LPSYKLKFIDKEIIKRINKICVEREKKSEEEALIEFSIFRDMKIAPAEKPSTVKADEKSLYLY